MSKYAPFNPNDPAEQLADRARQLVAEAGVKIMMLPEIEKAKANPALAVSSILSGVLTAACGIAIAQMKPEDEAHEEIRAWMSAYLPQAFDQARGIFGLPPLPEADQ